MNSLAILALGLYMVFAGWHGNAAPATGFVAGQKKFIPWLIAVLVLYGLYQVQALKPAVKAVAALALVAIFLKQFPTIDASIKELEAGTLTQSTTGSATQSTTGTVGTTP